MIRAALRLAAMCLALLFGVAAADGGLFSLGVSSVSLLDGAIDSIANSEARECFRDAYTALEGSCRDMSETGKRIIAVR